MKSYAVIFVQYLFFFWLECCFQLAKCKSQVAKQSPKAEKIAGVMSVMIAFPGQGLDFSPEEGMSTDASATASKALRSAHARASGSADDSMARLGQLEQWEWIQEDSRNHLNGMRKFEGLRLHNKFSYIFSEPKLAK